MNNCAIILAAGKGTRMGGGKQKSLRKINGKEIIIRNIGLLNKIGIDNIYIVIHYQSEEMKKTIAAYGLNCKFIYQDKLLGTAHAVKIALEKISKNYDKTLIVFGDDPAFYSLDTLEELVNDHNIKTAKFLVLQKEGIANTGGLEIIENNILSVLTRESLKKLKSNSTNILCGYMCFNTEWLRKKILLIKQNNISKEYLLTDIIKLAAVDRDYIKAQFLKSKSEWANINSYKELLHARKMEAKLK